MCKIYYHNLKLSIRIKYGSILLCLGPNIALYKMASQGPGVWVNGTADKAVDGNPSREADQNMCAHTDDAPSSQSWWTVDLGDAYRITGIKIRNRERKGCTYPQD